MSSQIIVPVIVSLLTLVGTGLLGLVGRRFVAGGHAEKDKSTAAAAAQMVGSQSELISDRDARIDKLEQRADLMDGRLTSVTAERDQLRTDIRQIRRTCEEATVRLTADKDEMARRAAKAERSAQVAEQRAQRAESRIDHLEAEVRTLRAKLGIS